MRQAECVPVHPEPAPRPRGVWAARHACAKAIQYRGCGSSGFRAISLARISLPSLRRPASHRLAATLKSASAFTNSIVRRMSSARRGDIAELNELAQRRLRRRRICIFNFGWETAIVAIDIFPRRYSLDLRRFVECVENQFAFHVFANRQSEQRQHSRRDIEQSCAFDSFVCANARSFQYENSLRPMPLGGFDSARAAADLRFQIRDRKQSGRTCPVRPVQATARASNREIDKCRSSLRDKAQSRAPRFRANAADEMA